MKVIVLKSSKPLSEFYWEDAEIEEGTEIYIGRSDDCHVQIDDPLISRHQCVLRFENSKWLLTKLSTSSNISVRGTVVSGETDVHQGDVIVFAPYGVSLESLPGSRNIAASLSTQDLQSSVTGLSGQTQMKDDLPPLEDLSITAVLPTETPHPIKPAPAPTERTQELAESLMEEREDELREDDVLADSIEESNTEDEASGLDGLDYSGEEDIIGTPESDIDETDDAGAEEAAEPSQASSFEGFGGATENDISTSMQQDGGGDDSTRVLQKFAHFELQLFGEYAPYDVYSVDKPEVYIGRDPDKCQILLNDTEVSSVHAVVRKKLSSMVLEDLNSSNGTILNGQRINKVELNNGDEFIIGSTTFTVKISSDVIQSEAGRLMPVESGQVIEKIEEIEEEVQLGDSAQEMGFEQDAPVEKSVIKRILKDPKKKRLAYIVVGLLLAVLMLDEFSPTPQPKKEVAKKEEPAVKDVPKDPAKRVLSEEERRALEAKYRIAEAYVKEKKLDEALAELEQIFTIDPSYSDAKTLHKYVQEQNRKLKEEQERLRQEAAQALVREEVKAMLTEAKKAVEEHNAIKAEQLFSKILEKDPENLDVSPLKMELEAWQSQERLKAEELARKEAERKRQVDALGPGKRSYLAREWYRAAVKLEEFLALKNMDEDLITEASEMLKDSRSQLDNAVAPILGRARSLKEGQDLKGAYEVYLNVLKIDPVNKEGLDEVDSIKEQLEMKSKKIYREAIIAESLSLFGDAKEKFQEVQQISPSDSDYYKKATEKLKNYLE